MLEHREIKTQPLHEAREQAEIAARIRANQVVTRLQQQGKQWTLSVKPREN